jgi:signal transduction histidine kinase
MADSSMKQIAPLKRLVQERLDEQKTKLVRYAAGRMSQGPQARARGVSGFDVIGLVQPTAGGQWAPQWIERNPGTKAEQWPQGHETVLIKSLPYARVKDGEMIWVRVSDPQALPVYAMMISVEIQNAIPQGAPGAPADPTLPDGTDYAAAPSGTGKKAIVVGFATGNPLADVTEDYIGSVNTVYLVDERGYIASHVNKAYLGALFTEDPIVSEIVKAKKAAASGNYDDIERQPVMGHYEKVDRTNLYAVITSPLSTAQDLVNNHVSTALSTGAAVGLFGLILAFLLGRSIAQPIEDASAAIRAINRGEPHGFRPLDTKDEIGTLTRLLAESSPAALASKASWNLSPGSKGDSSGSNKGGVREDTLTETSSTGTKTGTETGLHAKLASERKAVYDLFKEGFTNAMKEPLLAILGHAQLTKTKAEEAEIRNHAESIEREARRAKEVLERLHAWAGSAEEVGPTETMDLRTTVIQVFEKNASTLKTEQIDVVLDLHQVPLVHGSSGQIEKALTHVIDNAREALKARPQKQIKVQLDYLSDSIYLSVGDTGVGMSRDVKEKAFDPFFRGFQSAKGMGLGLAFVQSALDRIGAHCDIETVPGEGATFTMKFPVSTEEKQAFRQQEVGALANSISEAFATPPPPRDENANEPTKTVSVLAEFEPAQGAEEILKPEPKPASKVDSSPEIKAAEKPAIAVPPTLPPNPLQIALQKALGKIKEKPAANAAPAQAEAKAQTQAASASKPVDQDMPKQAEPKPFSFDDDDDDDSEAFANMSLKDAFGSAKSPAKPAEASLAPGATSTVASASGGVEVVANAGAAKPFEVKIRRPKARG